MLATYVLKQGECIPLHDHTFNHYTLIISGAAVQFDESGDVGYLLPNKSCNTYLMQAGKKHGIRAEIDGTVVINVMDVGEVGITPPVMTVDMPAKG